VIRIDATSHGEVRVIGVLEEEPLSGLLGARGHAEMVINLSEVREADAAAVRMLARLPARRCKLVDCPRWLALWIERERPECDDAAR
jgi:hypothetical protein